MRLPKQLLCRKPDAHKGDFGHIFILAGSLRFSGAAVLCAEGAIRSGAGLVTLGVPGTLAQAIIRIKPKEVMLLALPETREATLSISAYQRIKDFVKNIDVLVIGPGLTQNKTTQKLIRRIVSRLNKSTVIDADGLNALAGNLNLLGAVKSEKILTPHPGELARLLKTGVDKVRKNRQNLAKKFSLDYKVALVLKGYRTVVADCSGKLYINRTGNPGMARGGSGDVLTGMIAAFWAQGLNKFDAAKYAVYLHGLAGDLAAKDKTQLGMIPSDIIAHIPEAIKKCSLCRRSSVGRAAVL